MDHNDSPPSIRTLCELLTLQRLIRCEDKHYNDAGTIWEESVIIHLKDLHRHTSSITD
jgi:hypothetical protein